MVRLSRALVEKTIADLGGEPELPLLVSAVLARCTRCSRRAITRLLTALKNEGAVEFEEIGEKEVVVGYELAGRRYSVEEAQKLEAKSTDEIVRSYDELVVGFPTRRGVAVHEYPKRLGVAGVERELLKITSWSRLNAFFTDMRSRGYTASQAIQALADYKKFGRVVTGPNVLTVAFKKLVEKVKTVVVRWIAKVWKKIRLVSPAKYGRNMEGVFTAWGDESEEDDVVSAAKLLLEAFLKGLGYEPDLYERLGPEDAPDPGFMELEAEEIVVSDEKTQKTKISVEVFDYKYNKRHSNEKEVVGRWWDRFEQLERDFERLGETTLTGEGYSKRPVGPVKSPKSAYRTKGSWGKQPSGAVPKGGRPTKQKTLEEE